MFDPVLLNQIREQFHHVDTCPYQGSRAYFENAGGSLKLKTVVETGERQDGWIEVRRGLDAGDVVVAEGAYYLSDGVQVIVREDGA